MVHVSFRHFKSTGKLDYYIFYGFRFLAVHFFFFCMSLVERSAQIPASSYFFDNFHAIEGGDKWYILFITGLQYSLSFHHHI